MVTIEFIVFFFFNKQDHVISVGWIRAGTELLHPHGYAWWSTKWPGLLLGPDKFGEIHVGHMFMNPHVGWSNPLIQAGIRQLASPSYFHLFSTVLPMFPIELASFAMVFPWFSPTFGPRKKRSTKADAFWTHLCLGWGYGGMIYTETMKKRLVFNMDLTSGNLT